MTKRLTSITFIAAIGIFCALYLTRAASPLNVNDSVKAYQAEQIAYSSNTWNIFTAPPYTVMLAGIIKLFGISEISLRLPGIASVFMIFFLLFILIKIAYPSAGKSTIALLILAYAAHPAITQGSVTLDQNIILSPLIFLVVLWAMAEFDGRFTRWAILTISTTIFFSLELSAPLAFITIFFAYLLLHGKRMKYALAITSAWITGFCIFFIYWASITGNGEQTYKLFQYLPHISMLTILKNIVYIISWLNPYFVILVIMAFAVKNENDSQKYFKIATLSLLLHILTKPVNFGFPNDYIIFISLGFIITAPVVERVVKSTTKDDLKKIFIFTSALLTVFFLSGDPIHAVRVSARNAMVAVNTPQAMLIITSIIIKWSTVFLLAFWVSYSFFRKNNHHHPASIAILTCLFASLLAMSVRQANARYETGYSYGEIGTSDVIKKILPLRTKYTLLVAPSNISYYCGLMGQIYDPDVIHDPKNILALAETKYDTIIVESKASMPMEVYKSIQQYQPLKKYLENKFVRQRLGTYTIYTKVKPYEHDNCKL